MNTIERKIITYTIERAKLYGWIVFCVDVGAERYTCTRLTRILELLKTDGGGTVVFSQGDRSRRAWIHFVLNQGNGGRDVLANNSMNIEDIASQAFEYGESL